MIFSYVTFSPFCDFVFHIWDFNPARLCISFGSNFSSFLHDLSIPAPLKTPVCAHGHALAALPRIRVFNGTFPPWARPASMRGPYAEAARPCCVSFTVGKQLLKPVLPPSSAAVGRPFTFLRHLHISLPRLTKLAVHWIHKASGVTLVPLSLPTHEYGTSLHLLNIPKCLSKLYNFPKAVI